jgi:uncharacterized protein (TIGR03437 family)
MSFIRWVLVGIFISLSANAAVTQWADLGGSVTGKISVAKNSDGRLEAFARWQDNSLRYSVQSSAGSTEWSGWTSLGGTLASDPVAALNKDGRIDIFAISSDTTVSHIEQSSPGSNAFTAWASLGGQARGNPFVLANADGRLEVFIFTVRFGMWHAWQTSPDGGWSGGTEITGNLVSSPAAGLNSDGRVVVFTGDDDGRDWWIIQNNTGQDSWSPWWCLLGGTVTSPLVGTNKDGTLEIFAVRSDGSVWTSTQTAPGSYNYTDWAPLGGNINGDLAVTSNADGRLEIFGRGTDNALWHASQTSPGGTWSGWSSLGGTLANSPSAALDANGLVQVFAQNSSGTTVTIGQSSPGSWAVSTTALPAISSTNAAIPVWNGATNFSANMFASIYGSNLSTVTTAWDNAFDGSNAPTTLGGVKVLVNNIPAFVQYVSPTQININVPADSATGLVNVVVQNSAGSSNTGTATRSRLSPTFLSDPRFASGSKTYVVAQTPDFKSFIGPAGLFAGPSFTSAKPGDIIIIYATGCGPTNPVTSPGVIAAQNSPLASAYQVSIGGVQAQVAFAGLIQGTVGLYQFNIVVPNVSPGDQPINLVVDGVSNGQNLMLTVGR